MVWQRAWVGKLNGNDDEKEEAAESVKASGGSGILGGEGELAGNPPCWGGLGGFLPGHGGGGSVFWLRSAVQSNLPISQAAKQQIHTVVCRDARIGQLQLHPSTLGQ